MLWGGVMARTKQRKCDFCQNPAYITIEIKRYKRVGHLCYEVKCQDKFHREVERAQVS